MTFLQRVATVAAISMTLTGLAGVGTPGIAADVNRAPALVQPVTASVNNTLTPQAVPTATPAVLTKTDETPLASETPTERQAETAKFESLAEAVAAQDQAASDDTLRCLATAVYFESKSEPMVGQLAVAQVIINRTKSGRFPSDVCGVVKQRGQFAFMRSGTLPTLSAGLAQYRTALKVAKVALTKAWSSPAPTALYFNGRGGTGFGRTVVASIGNHIFYR